MLLTVKEENGRFDAFTENGNLFGTLDGSEHGYKDGDRIIIKHAYAVDGNLRIITKETAVEETE